MSVARDWTQVLQHFPNVWNKKKPKEMTTWKPLTFLKPKTGICLRFCSKASECMRSVGWGQAALQAVAGVGPKISPEILSTFICSCTNQQVASCQGDNKEEEEGKIFPIKRGRNKFGEMLIPGAAVSKIFQSTEVQSKPPHSLKHLQVLSHF